MTLKNTIGGIILITCLGIISAFYFAGTVRADGPVVNIFFKVATSSSETVPTTSVTVAATSTGRTFLKLSNDSSNQLFCNYGKTAIGGQGFIVNASSSYTMNGFTEPVFTGALNCIASSTSAVYVMANQ